MGAEALKPSISFYPSEIGLSSVSAENKEFMNFDRESLLDKARARASVRARLRNVSEAQRTKFSHEALALLRGRAEWQGARFILGYLALKDELDLSSVLQIARAEGKTV